ncbi:MULTISPECIES: hypothetical protein [unclassified Enterococcus]|uniref:hypothetical protein n=1 Tax=unclassified Enterococcus TaxID=2608891 RepID=UPI003F2589AD
MTLEELVKKSPSYSFPINFARGNILFDSEQGKYLAKSKGTEPDYYLTSDKQLAYRFSDNEISLAWHTAYKCAWLGLGKFYVHGE